MREFSKEYNTYIEWESTGEVLDEVSCYDWEEGAEGIGEDGREYTASFTMSCDEVIEINCIELK